MSSPAHPFAPTPPADLAGPAGDIAAPGEEFRITGPDPLPSEVVPLGTALRRILATPPPPGVEGAAR